MIRNILGGAGLLLLLSPAAFAFDPFVVKDIRVEGIQRTEAGTVFGYLPVKVGETFNDDKAADAIKSLFATGFFKDVRIEVENGVLVVIVEERPAIASIDFVGMTEFDKDGLKKGLREIGLAESRIFDKSMLDKAEQELKRQYLTKGKYGVSIATTVTPLERNRVAINFTIDEGEVAKIRQINIVGNQAFKESELLDLFVLRTPGMMTWYTKNDQYSKQKLSADIESLKSYYLNRGYLEFNVDSTQVSISPDKKDIYITVSVTEGDRFTVSDVRLAGDLLLPESDLKKLVVLRPGDVFSREKLTDTTKAIGDRLAVEGYAFANVNAAPEIDKENKKVAFTVFVDPGKRVNVRRINVAGNARTRDEVIRREFRQMEGSWYDLERINKSKTRIDRLGFFDEVNIETPAVSGTTDQVDVNVSVKERPTGSLMVGAGFSSSEKLVLTGSISQNNLFGSGNAMTLQVNSGSINKVYALSFTNPYFTVDGASAGFDIYKRNIDPTSLSIAKYKTSSTGAGVRYGLPIGEDDMLNFGLSYDRTTVETYSDSPQRYIDFVNTFGSRTSTLLGTVGWANDQRDSFIYPTKGSYKRATGELSLPGGTLRFYRLTYQYQRFFPLSRDYTLMLNGEAGYANGYSNKPLPFFKNYYAGGIGSVRGFDTSTLGPRDAVSDEALGGNRRLIGSAEFLFPFPGSGLDRSLRLAWFVDAGQVWGKEQQIRVGDLRYSTGFALSWASPIGPMRFSLGQPLKRESGDRLQRFQFQLGTVF